MSVAVLRRKQNLFDSAFFFCNSSLHQFGFLNFQIDFNDSSRELIPVVDLKFSLAITTISLRDIT